MQMLVKKNDKVEVEVYVWEDEKGNIEATHDKALIPDKLEKVETALFTFRRPNYSDSTTILRQSNVREEGQLDVAAFQDVVLRTLLVGCNIKDELGQPLSAKGGQILNTLQPAIARSACAGCLEKINLF